MLEARVGGGDIGGIDAERGGVVTEIELDRTSSIPVVEDPAPVD